MRECCSLTNFHTLNMHVFLYSVGLHFPCVTYYFVCLLLVWTSLSYEFVALLLYVSCQIAILQWSNAKGVELGNICSLSAVWLMKYCSTFALSSPNLFRRRKLAREKGRDLTQSYDKSPCTNRNVRRAKWQHKQRNKKFDYRAVADRLRTVSWSNYGHPTGVVNLVYGPNLPTPRNSRVIKRTHV